MFPKGVPSVFRLFVFSKGFVLRVKQIMKVFIGLHLKVTERLSL